MYRVASQHEASTEPSGPPWTNRLVHATSPYLLQHAHNPVDWRPWGEHAFQKARAEDKPIFLSIGYAACHWCHVMERESFEDAEVAAYLNDHFVAVKVDREERPDVDAIYIEALIALQGQAGWPASLFLFPDLRPFAGATYLPPTPRHGMPSFRDVLERVRAFWSDQRERLEHTGGLLLQALERTLPPGPAALDAVGYAQAVAQIVASSDPTHGGHGQGQKFPQTPLQDLLLLGACDGLPGAGEALERSLRVMASRGLYDHLGGGFHRYCVDRAWTVPHFEKMLYDNAQLLRLYARAASGVLTGDLAQQAVRVCRETAHYLMTELSDPSGAFWSSQDADDPGGEGFYYTFTPADLNAALPAHAGIPYDIREGGNFEHGRTVLSVEHGRPQEAVRQRLIAYRSRRARPATDTKLVTAWNGMALGALAEAGRLLECDAWVDRAAACAEALWAARVDGLLPRLVTGAEPGTLEDQACVIDGLLDLYQARPHEPLWLDRATALATAVGAYAASGGAFHQSLDREDLVVRRVDFQDGAEPSGNGRLAGALQRLQAYGAPIDHDLEALLAAASGTLARAPLACPELWAVVRALATDRQRELVITGAPGHPVVQQMLRVWNARWRPQAVLAVVQGDEAGGYGLFEGKAATSTPRAYLCRQGRCDAPIATPEALAEALDGR